MKEPFRPADPRSEAGFTLVEALVAMVILSFGLMAVTNLFLVGGTSNKVANHSTAATAQATEVMERLKSIPFTTFVSQMGTRRVVGSLTGNVADDTSLNVLNPAACGGTDRCCAEAPTPPSSGAFTSTNCVVPANYNMTRDVTGVGRIRVRWQIVAPGAGGTDVLYFVVRAESMAPIVGGQRSRAEMTTFRACTLTGCPF